MRLRSSIVMMLLFFLTPYNTQTEFNINLGILSGSPDDFKYLVKNHPLLTLSAIVAASYSTQGYWVPQKFKTFAKEQPLLALSILVASGYITQNYWLTPTFDFFNNKDPYSGYAKELDNDKELTVDNSQDGFLSKIQECRARIYKPGDIKTRLVDVAGLDAAKDDLYDIMSYLKNPKAFLDMGAKVPKGVLIKGPPGNGKTLLAKAVAGEVDCPFLSISASEFIEAIVGIGAARIRDLFAKAKELAPCIIFIDEFDAVAKKRSSHSFGGGGDEQAQTLAQLLVLMDGFDMAENPIIVLAATNRAEVLDPAILRPGRFDRAVQVNNPYIKDRCDILKIHLNKITKSDNIDVQRIARATMGFSGAELSRLINDAAILAVADKSEMVEMHHIDLAYDHITLGRETKGMDQIEHDLWQTAIHEAGHAIAYIFQEKAKPLHKVTITPRGGALGVTHSLPLREQYNVKEDEMRASIIVSLCGGLAEQEFGMGKSSGVSSDLSKARDCAYNMVVRYGMSEDLIYISYADIDNHLPNDIATEVHKAVQKIIDECYLEAKDLIASHKNDIESLAELLIEKGTVFGDEVYRMFGLEEPKIEYSLT